MIKILDSENGDFYFDIVTADGKVAATSRYFDTKEKAFRAARAINSIPHDIGDFTTRKNKKAGGKAGSE